MALAAASRPGVALATVVGISGSFSRRLGAQLAARTDGSIAGNLSDGCLEQQLARDGREATVAEVRRYGSGSPLIDFRLPCGGGLDILIDPEPDRAACRAAVEALAARRPATLALPPNGLLEQRRYIPSLRVRAFGEPAELTAFVSIAQAAGIPVEGIEKEQLSLGRRSDREPVGAWTAVVMLFHDHEWELALLEEALESDAFYIGAQGGAKARDRRIDEMQRRGVGESTLARVRCPIGSSPGSRTPEALALSVLAEIAGEYERLHPIG
jgi:xanthine dehydrogenase accessory factor